MLLAGVLVRQDVVGHDAHMGGGQGLLRQRMPTRPGRGLRGSPHHPDLQLSWLPKQEPWAVVWDPILSWSRSRVPADALTTVND